MPAPLRSYGFSSGAGPPLSSAAFPAPASPAALAGWPGTWGHPRSCAQGRGRGFWEPARQTSGKCVPVETAGRLLQDSGDPASWPGQQAAGGRLREVEPPTPGACAGLSDGHFERQLAQPSSVGIPAAAPGTASTADPRPPHLRPPADSLCLVVWRFCGGWGFARVWSMASLYFTPVSLPGTPLSPLFQPVPLGPLPPGRLFSAAHESSCVLWRGHISFSAQCSDRHSGPCPLVRAAGRSLPIFSSHRVSKLVLLGTKLGDAGARKNRPGPCLLGACGSLGDMGSSDKPGSVCLNLELPSST